MNKRVRQVGAAAIGLLLVAGAWGWYEATPERTRARLEREVAKLAADSRSEAADRVREVAACTADAVEFGSQSAVASSCWAQLRIADIARTRGAESRDAALVRLQGRLDAIR